MLLLDTNVLVYAVGGDHPLRPPAIRLLEAAASGATPATTTVEVLQEFAHVRARRRGRTDAAHLTRSYADLLSPLVRPDAADLDLGLRLFERSDRLGAFDAVLAATALNREHITAIVTAGDGFDDVDGLAVRRLGD